MEYEESVCKALTTETTIAGGSRKPVVLNGTLAMVSIFATNSFYYLPIFFLVHGWIILASKKDPYFFSCFLAYIKNKEYYHS